jgi:HK97 family phage portal protein
MGWLQKMLTKRQAPSPLNLASGLSSPFFRTGDIQKNTTVQACVNAIANPVAILPLNLYFRNPKDGSRQKAGWHQLHTIMRKKPNSWESPTQFVAKLMRHVLAHGNAYIWKGYSGDKVVALQLLNPEAVKRDVSMWPVVRYWYNSKAYTDAEILHIPALVTDDAGTGISAVELARAAVTLGIQLDEYSLSSFGNGLNTKLLIDIAEMTKDVKNEEEASKLAATVSDYIRRNYAGADNAGKALILWSGMKAQELKNQSSNRDAELLESRKWQEAEICKIFGVPQWMVNHSMDVKYGGLEQAMTVFINFTLSPYLRHIEQRLNTLLSEYESDAYYFEFDFNVLLRPDEKSRAEFYTKLFQMGAIDANGICARENIEPPAEAGDTRFVPANLMPLTAENMDAYMASAKAKAAGTLDPKVQDPARAAGDDKL